MTYSIRKSSQKFEKFNKEKFIRSLQLAGTDKKLIDKIIKEVEKQKPRTTKQLHKLVSNMLNQDKPHIAARYNIKRALMDLGPAGYPFEQFVAQLFKAEGYKVSTNQFISGFCVEHEVDIIAHAKNKHYMIECKFHNRFNLKSDVKVALYTHARFEDIKKAWLQDKTHEQEFHQCHIVTNTTFTTNAIQYAQCTNITLLGWAYPLNNGIETLIDKFGLHPITALTNLTQSQKRKFIKEGFVLCKDAGKHTNILKNLGFTQREIQKFVAEAKKVCTLEN